jgi:hypothetical protein
VGRALFDTAAIDTAFSRHNRVDSLPERGVRIEIFSRPGAARKIDRERRPVGLSNSRDPLAVRVLKGRDMEVLINLKPHLLLSLAQPYFAGCWVRASATGPAAWAMLERAAAPVHFTGGVFGGK